MSISNLVIVANCKSVEREAREQQVRREHAAITLRLRRASSSVIVFISCVFEVTAVFPRRNSKRESHGASTSLTSSENVAHPRRYRCEFALASLCIHSWIASVIRLFCTNSVLNLSVIFAFPIVPGYKFPL